MPKNPRVVSQPPTPAIALPAGPRIGDLVLYQCKNTSQKAPSEMAAIVQHVVDSTKHVVNLTIFTDAGPVMKRDVAPWTDTSMEGWAART